MPDTDIISEFGTLNAGLAVLSCLVFSHFAQEWKAAGSPVPLCLVLYEPIVTLLSMNTVLAAMAADDSRHLRWLNELDRFVQAVARFSRTGPKTPSAQTFTEDYM